MIKNLRVGSSNYFTATNIHRADGGDLSGTAGTAFIFLTTDEDATPLTDSNITLTVDGTVASGTFPATVPLTAGLNYVVRSTITDGDGSISSTDDEITASRG